MNNILVVNVNWLGDVIFSTPVFKALKKEYPGARVSCLAVPRVKDVLKACPWVDEVIIYDDKNEHWSPLGKWVLIRLLRKKNFEAVFLLHGSMTRGMLVWLAGIPQRIGYDSKKQNGFLTHRVKLEEDVLHRSDEYLKILEGFGLAVADRVCELDVPSSNLAKIDQRLRKAGIKPEEHLVVINTGGNWDLKRWPAANFSILITRLVKDFGVKVLIPGAPSDVPLAKRIARDSGVDPLVWAGETGLNDLFALFKRAHLVISNDSGPLHAASSVGTDVIALFGPTRPEVTGPRGGGRAVVLHNDIGCNKAPCYHLACSDNACMSAITVEDVLQAYQKLRR